MAIAADGWAEYPRARGGGRGSWRCGRECRGCASGRRNNGGVRARTRNARGDDECPCAPCLFDSRSRAAALLVPRLFSRAIHRRVPVFFHACASRRSFSHEHTSTRPRPRSRPSLALAPPHLTPLIPTADDRHRPDAHTSAPPPAYTPAPTPAAAAATAERTSSAAARCPASRPPRRSTWSRRSRTCSRTR